MRSAAVIYDRNASPHSVALEARLQRCIDYANAHDLEIGGAYIDVGMNALDGAHRPELDSACELIKQTSAHRDVSLLLVSWDRLSNEPLTQSALANRAERAGARVVVVDDPETHSPRPAKPRKATQLPAAAEAGNPR